METNSQDTAAPPQQLVDLKILSPSTGLEGGVDFPGLLASTTIRELKRKLHDSIPFRPEVERMRLIYLGRVVANESDTLVEVFGSDKVGIAVRWPA